ncbi:unnamed protein product [Leptidea sinapis]|uniref:Uncharacterized protein n=1 Tax=Leptidea sinapis TaxID=189913 RepID=A0A5E4QRR9_9NEOP|nr:unnamed protein product [Leptidea sinapis]
MDSDSVGGVSDDDSDYKPDEDLVDHTEEQNCIENGLVKGEAELLGRFEVAHRLPTRKSLHNNSPKYDHSPDTKRQRSH